MHILRLVLQYFLTACWKLLTFVYRQLQWCVWLTNGTYSELTVRRRPEHYGCSAQVMKIVFRFKLDQYLTPANVNDFILTHERFESPDYVLQDHISLYQVTEKEAIFIEAAPGTELWRAKDHTPFIMPSQFKYGIKVVRMPIASFYRLTDTLGDPKGQLIFLCNTARCGSTLLTQMFEVTNKVIAISEPSPLNVLAKMTEKSKRTAEVKRLITGTVRVLCKPTSNHEIAYVLKLTSPSMQGIPFVAELFPEAKHLFMYRDSLKVAQSVYRLSEELPALKTLFVLGKGSERRLGWCVEAMGMPADAFKFCLSYDLSIGTMLSGAMIKIYERFRASGIDIAAVRYEDIVGKPVESMRIILKHVGLPERMADDAKAALQWDSQRNTPLANTVLRRHRTLEYGGPVKEECDRICDRIGVPHLDVSYITPGTITAE